MKEGFGGFESFVTLVTDAAKRAFHNSLRDKRVREGSQVIKTGAHALGPDEFILVRVTIEAVPGTVSDAEAQRVVKSTD